jgi:hypothetical protein
VSACKMMFVDIDEHVFVRPIDRGIMNLNQLGWVHCPYVSQFSYKKNNYQPQLIRVECARGLQFFNLIIKLINGPFRPCYPLNFNLSFFFYFFYRMNRMIHRGPPGLISFQPSPSRYMQIFLFFIDKIIRAFLHASIV